MPKSRFRTIAQTSITAVAPAPIKMASTRYSITSGTRALLCRSRRRASTDHPAGGGKANLRAMNIGIESAADGFDDLRARVVVRFVKDLAEGAEPRHIADQLFLGKTAGNIDRPDIDAAPSAFLKDGM